MTQPQYIIAMSRVLNASRITVDLPLRFMVREDGDIVVECDRCGDMLAHWTETQWVRVLFADVLFTALSHVHMGVTANGETKYGTQALPFPDEPVR